MSKGEDKFWDKIRAGLQSMGEVDRIESHATSIGRPDINMCLNPGIVWDIELKYSDDGKVKMRPSQRGWFKRRARVHGQAMVLTHVVTSREDMFMVNMVNHIPEEDDLDAWILVAHIIWDGGINWGQFEEILRTPYVPF